MDVEFVRNIRNINIGVYWVTRIMAHECRLGAERASEAKRTSEAAATVMVG